MADSQPFANAGLGMFGNERQFIQAGMTPPETQRTLKHVLGIMLGGLTGEKEAAGVAPPALGQGLSMPVMPGGQGVNPNKRSAIGISPGAFTFSNQSISPTSVSNQSDNDHNSLVDKFWG